MGVEKPFVTPEFARRQTQYEVRKCPEIGFRGDQIVQRRGEKACRSGICHANDLYLINVDSLYELETWLMPSLAS